jgi:poly-gamma-glutamate synthesis protein (capsule biosynthesis protein)
VRAARIVIVAIGVSLLAACSSANAQRVAAPAATTTVPVTSPPTRVIPPSTTTTTRPKPKPTRGSVTFAFAGDVHFEGPLRAKLAANPLTVLAPIAPVLRKADIAMVNLETAITQRGTPEKKIYTFRAPPSALTALAAAGIDVATEANNHGVDLGQVGLADTLVARAQSPHVRVVGIGQNADDAYGPFRATINGERIAIIGASQLIDDPFRATWPATDSHPGIASAFDIPRLVRAVYDARATSDIVVVYLHWGDEGTHCPTSLQRYIAPLLVNAGADIVLGSHSHQLEGAGHLGNALIDYGLGNFAFYTGTTSGVLTVTMTGRHVDRYGWVPASISGGVPNPVTGTAIKPAVAAWQALRNCTGLAS